MLQIAVSAQGIHSVSIHANRELAYIDWAHGLKHRTRLDYLLDPSAGSPCHIDALMHMLVEERFTDIKSSERPEIEGEALRADDPGSSAAAARDRGDSYVVAYKPRY